MPRPRSYSPFAEAGPALRDIGYRVIPLTPPPHLLKQRLNEHAQQSFGKVPGECHAGYWKPMDKWNIFAQRDATPIEFEKWLSWRRANIGLPAGITLEDGATLAFLDDDHEDGRLKPAFRYDLYELLDGAPTRKGRKGSAFVFALVSKEPVRSGKVRPAGATKLDPEFKDAFDFMASGGQIAIPPSIHPKTKLPYTWTAHPLDQTPPSALPRVRIEDLDAVFHRHGYSRTSSVDSTPDDAVTAAVRDAVDRFDPKAGDKLLEAIADIRRIHDPHPDRSVGRVSIAIDMIRRGYSPADFALAMLTFEDAGLEKFTGKELIRQIARSYARGAKDAVTAPSDVKDVSQEVLADYASTFHPSTPTVPAAEAAAKAYTFTTAFIRDAVTHAASQIYRQAKFKLRDLDDLTPDEIDDLHQPPVPYADLTRQSLKISVGSGKSHAAADAIADYIKDPTPLPFNVPKRVAILVPDHSLAAETYQRLIQRKVRAMVYRGAGATNPETASAMCARAPEAEAASRLGVSLDDLCGTKNSPCPFRDACAYRAQKALAAHASVVIFAGPAALKSTRPWFARTARVRTTDLAGNPNPKPTTLTVAPFDFTFIDEFNPTGMLSNNSIDSDTDEKSTAYNIKMFAPLKSKLADQTLLYSVNTRIEKFKPLFKAIRHYKTPNYLFAHHLYDLDFTPSSLNTLVNDLYRLKLKLTKLNLIDNTILSTPDALTHLPAGSQLGDAGTFNRKVAALITFARAVRQALADLSHRDDNLYVDFKVSDADDLEGYNPPDSEDLPDDLDERRVAQLFVNCTTISKPDSDKTEAVNHTLVVSHRHKIAAAFYKTSMLVMDASMDNELAACTLRGLKPLPEVRAADGHVTRTQITDRTLSNSFIQRSSTAIESLQERLLHLCKRNLEVGLICTKLVHDQLAPWVAQTKTPNLKILHFGAVRGQNIMEKVDHLMIFGRPAIRVSAVEHEAWLLKGIVPSNWTPLGKDFLEANDSAFLLHDGTFLPATRRCHPDPWVDRVRQAKVEEELVQAEGRGRACRRDEHSHLEVEINTATPIPGVIVHSTTEYGLRFIGDTEAAQAVRNFLRANFVPCSKPSWEAFDLLFGGGEAIWRTRLRRGSKLRNLQLERGKSLLRRGAAQWRITTKTGATFELLSLKNVKAEEVIEVTEKAGSVAAVPVELGGPFVRKVRLGG